MLQDEKPQRARRRTSYSSEGSDEFSLWSDTGDIAEQLAEEEDPLRIDLGRGNGGPARGTLVNGPRTRKPERHVHYLDQLHLERKTTNPGIDKEAIIIPEPKPRLIPTWEKVLATIMAPNDPQTARRRGLVGKPLV